MKLIFFILLLPFKIILTIFFAKSKKRFDLFKLNLKKIFIVGIFNFFGRLLTLSFASTGVDIETLATTVTQDSIQDKTAKSSINTYFKIKRFFIILFFPFYLIKKIWKIFN